MALGHNKCKAHYFLQFYSTLIGLPKLVGPRVGPKGNQTLICPNTLIPNSFQKNRYLLLLEQLQLSTKVLDLIHSSSSFNHFLLK